MTAAESGELSTSPSTRTTPEESGLLRRGEFVILSGPELKAILECVLIAIRHRRRDGLPYRAYEALACELHEALSAGGQSDVRLRPISKPVPVEPPTVPIAEAAERLDVSDRQARRLAPKLGGQRIAGRWFVDELALRQHTEGKT